MTLNMGEMIFMGELTLLVVLVALIAWRLR